MERRLAAILAADVVGYSRLMEADEEATVGLLNTCWKFIDDRIDEHSGRVFGSAGDSVIAEFASPVEALRCAVEVQQELGKRNADLPEDRRMHFRIGINLGDVMVQGDNLLGDGVNIAARLETLADVGGINISGTVFDHVAGKLDLTFDDLGEQRLKNIAKPVRVYRVRSDAVSGSDTAGFGAPVESRDKPSIAVLPFENMSADPEQEFLADGISEDIITGLSKIRWFLVIARNSTFTYKGQAADVKRVAEELSVRYVLEGSIRKAGNRIRVTAQLIDAVTGLHVWAELYDKELQDIFDLQDEITRTIVARVEPDLAAAERDRAISRRTNHLDAWECYQRGLWNMWDYGRTEHYKAMELLTQATELDPNFSTAHAYLSYTYYHGVVLGWTDDPAHDLELGMNAARRALQVDDKDPVGYFAIGRIYMMQGEHDASIAALETAIELNPSFSQAYHGLGTVLSLAGQLDEGRAALKNVERLSPRDPILWASIVMHALADVLAGDTESALEMAQRTLQMPRAHSYWPHAVYAAALVQAGRIEEARSEVQAALRELPDLTLTYLRNTYLTREPGGLNPYLDALRTAGLPE